tara:strand:+ start:410 stop:1063 length:654 start_codon:yes stop_codon:yes gene_type:complete
MFRPFDPGNRGFRMNKKMLDLFSGLGGASESFINNGWEVKRIESNQELSLVPNTTIMDVRDFETFVSQIVECGGSPDPPTLLWASPPCTHFSNGYASPKSVARRNGDVYHPEEAISLVQTTLNIIELLRPKYWIIENVKGSVEFLEPLLGPPKMIIDSIYLWGRFPKWTMEPGYKHIKDDAWSTTPLRANIRAKIPYAISDACRQSIENTKTLDYWY